MKYNNIFGSRRQGYTAKGLIATGGLLAAGIAIGLYGVSKTDDLASKVSDVLPLR